MKKKMKFNKKGITDWPMKESYAKKYFGCKDYNDKYVFVVHFSDEDIFNTKKYRKPPKGIFFDGEKYLHGYGHTFNTHKEAADFANKSGKLGTIQFYKKGTIYALDKKTGWADPPIDHEHFGFDPDGIEIFIDPSLFEEEE